MRFLTETFTAGETKTIAMRGGYFKIFESFYDVNVKFFAAAGFGSPRAAADSVPAGFAYRPKEDFSGVSITSATAQVVTFIIADGDTELDRIIGEVSVIDGGRARTLSGNTFLAAPWCGPVVGQYAHAELWNPAGSGKNVSVKSIQMHSSTASGVSARFHNAQIAVANTNIGSKLYGGAAPSSLARTENNVALLGSGPVIFASAVVANGLYYQKFEEPLVLVPGSGLLMQDSTVGTDLGTIIEFTEDTI